MNDLNQKKPLLLECMQFTIKSKCLTEGVGDAARKLIVSGVLQRAEAKNQNGRVYPLEILQREAKKYEENFVKQKRAMGELDHPESSVVNLKNVSHNISRMWWDGSDLNGEVEILTTPSGNILKELFNCGITLGISSRGLGSVKKVNENTVEVDDDFELIAFDFVSNPSTIGAFMFPNGQLQESLQSQPAVLDPISNKWVKVEEVVHDILNEIR
jgi:hypothetical protein